MKLLEYLKQLPSVKARKSFAATVVVKGQPKTLHSLLNFAYGYRTIKPDLAIALERATNHVVTVEECCPEHDWAAVREGGPTRKRAA